MIKINDKFEPLFKEETRYYIITGERGASKSFSVNTWLTLKLLEHNQKALFTRYTLASAKDSIIPEFKEKIEILNLENRFDVQLHDITNHNANSSILFRGIKTSAGIQTAKLKSLTGVNIWIVDEAEELVDEDVFDKIDLSIREKHSKNIIILILNPASRQHWIYKRFFLNNVKEDFNGVKDNITYIYTTLEDNIENLDSDLVNELLTLKKNDPVKYKKRVHSAWISEDSSIVFNFSKLKRFKSVDYSNAEIVGHADIADSGLDYLCFVVCAVMNENIFVLDVCYSSLDSNYTMPKIQSMIEKYNIQTSWFESNNQGLMYTKMMIEKLGKGYKIKAYPNTTNKHSRIIIQADYIINNFYFKTTDDKEYNEFIDHLTCYRNDKQFKIDDAPDSLAGISKIIRRLL